MLSTNVLPNGTERILQRDDGSVQQDTLASGNSDILKELFDLTKLFRDFTAWMEGRAITGLYGILWEVLLTIHKMVEEYERFAAHYTALALNKSIH